MMSMSRKRIGQGRRGACRPRDRRAFTLIELLVVIAILALLVSILLPSLTRAKELAQVAICMSNLKGISFGHTMYGQDNNDILVPVHYGPSADRLYWFEALEPYMGTTDKLHATSTQMVAKSMTCPTWIGLKNSTTWAGTYADAIGIGMNRRPLLIWDTPTHYINSSDYFIDTLTIPPTSNLYKVHYSDVPYPSQRLINGDAKGDTCSPYPTTPTFFMREWEYPPSKPDGTYYGGDPIRHVEASRANYLFFDWHVETLVPARASEAFNVH